MRVIWKVTKLGDQTRWEQLESPDLSEQDASIFIESLRTDKEVFDIETDEPEEKQNGY